MEKNEFISRLRDLVSEFGFSDFVCFVGKDNIIDLAISPLPSDKVSGIMLDQVVQAAIFILKDQSSSASAEYFVVKNKS